MIMTIIGARPQFIKAAVVSRALNELGIEEIIVHTGQHYDQKMSAVFWQELCLPKPIINLEAGVGSQSKQTGMIISRLDDFICSWEKKINAVLLYGDTSSTLAGAIVASKNNLPVIHVESGLRSFNRTMPEEINRILTDHISSMLFCSSDVGVNQLKKEGITTAVFNVGDVMFDAVKIFRQKAIENIPIDSILPFSLQPFYLLTLHRPVNVDNIQNIIDLMTTLGHIKIPVVWPKHPRLKFEKFNLTIPSNVYVREPFTYHEMLCILSHCEKVLTDSGGLQKEAYWSKKPCVTLRNETEWVETMHNNWNVLTGLKGESILEAVDLKIEPNSWKPLYGDGHAAFQIARHIKNHFFL